MTAGTINWLSSNLSGVVALTAFLVTAVGYYLSLSEYYNKKAYWDYFYIHDLCRTSMRSGFHPEYLSLAAVILLVASLIICYLFQNKAFFIIDWPVKLLILCIAIFAVVSLALFLILWKFLLPEVNEQGIWKKRQFLKHIGLQALFIAIGITGACLVFLLAIVFFMLQGFNLVSIVLIAFVLVALQFANYSYNQRQLAHKKWLFITTYQNSTFAVIETNSDFMQLVACHITGDRKQCAELVLDDVVLLKTRTIAFEKMYFAQINRRINHKTRRRKRSIFKIFE
ncbi:hypothetical protein IZU99_09110 [Oscillospiraceae bacterium CM]|nr:hypothetical protein IZU99_09110 [Oscillospiraceae bacterium CM]